MRFLPFPLPDGLPISLWFFVVTAIVYLLQRFPLTGVFLMIVGAAFWSVVLVNLGMAGIVLEVVTRRVSLLWLLLPALYLGGFYLAWANDQRLMARVSADTVRFNEGKSLAFDPLRQDLVIERSDDGLGLGAAEFLQGHGLARVFDGNGRVHLIGAAETCKFLGDKPGLQSAGIHSQWITRPGPRRYSRSSTGFCIITMPGTPDRPVVRIREQQVKPDYGRLPVTLREYVATDEASGASASVRVGRASPLRRFPGPVMGCALNSGAPSWECFAGFLRRTVPVLPGMPEYGGGGPVLAKMLGLEPDENLAARAIGPERFRPLADRADAEQVGKELAVLEKLLADPTAPMRDSWFRHLPNKPEVLVPYAARIFAALRTLEGADIRGRDQGRNLWDLAAALPDDALAPHRQEMLQWLRPSTAKPWTVASSLIYHRLDAARPEEREILLQRMESREGDLELAKKVCRLGADAPGDARQRLLALWRRLGESKNRAERPSEHVPLYFALARLGLKGEAGQVEQRYFGTTYSAIWDRVGPETPAEICDLSRNDLQNWLRGLKT